MSKLIKKAAIYLEVKSEKEDNYFISQKLKRMKEVCLKENMELADIYINYGITTLSYFKSYINKIKDKQIKVIITEESEKFLSIINIELVNLDI